MKTNKKVEQIKKEITIGYLKFTNSNRRTTKQAIALGHLLNNLKKEVKQKKQSWQKYTKNTFPNIERKTRERFMRIAKYVGQDYPTALHLLPQTTLDSLRKLCGPDDIGTYLEKQGIDLTFKLKDKSVTTFQEKVVQLLEKSADEKRSSSSSGPVKIFYLWLDTLEKKLEKSQARLNKNKTNILKKIVARLLEIIENYSE